VVPKTGQSGSLIQTQNNDPYVKEETSATVPYEYLHFVMGAVEMEFERVSATLKNEAHVERIAAFHEVTDYA
jgi:hypothetical protein